MSRSTPDPPDPYLIRELRQLRALESPARVEIVDAFSASGPASIATVAHHLGRTPESLYYHVKKLLEVGLLEHAGERIAGKNREALYTTPARQMLLGSPGRSRAKLDSVVKIVRGNLQLGMRDVERAFRDPSSRFSGPERNVSSARVKAWLTESQLKEALGLLDRLDALMNGSTPGKNKVLYALGTVLTPIEPRSSARSRNSES